MDYPVTQLWDSRLLYIYALLGGYIKTGSDTISIHLTNIINCTQHKSYSIEILQKLENEVRIVVKSIGIGEQEKAAQYIAENFRNRKTERTSKEFRQLFAPPVPHKLQKLRRQVKDIEAKYIYIELTDIDTEWFRNTVSTYLKLFRQNNMFAPIGANPTLYEHQKHAIEAQLGAAGKTRLITGYQRGNSMRFIETILAMSDEGQIEISLLNPMILRGNSSEGSYRANVKVVGKNSFASSSLTTNEKAQQNTIHAPQEKWVVELVMESTQLYVNISGQKRYALKRLRAGNAPYEFMEFMYHNPYRVVARDEVEDVVSKDKSQIDLPKLVKDCGFNYTLKRIFFDKTSKTGTEFKRERSIGIELYEPLEEQLKKLASNSKKQRV
jgi:hypothetical protein